MMTKFCTIIMLILGSISCTHTAAQSKVIDPTAFEQMILTDTSVQLIDVRTPDEYQSGHIAKAVNYNINDASFGENLAKLDLNRPVLVYCAVGGRSGRAAAQLDKLGFKKVFDLRGGMTAWRAANKKIVK